MAAPLKHVYIYTDGSCDTTTGDGGWAYLLLYGTSKKEASAFEANTTNNRMELTAAVKALEALREPCKVTLTTDSQYLRKAFTDGWLEKWQRNGWKTAGKDPVKNQDLWEELLELTKTHTLKWEWTEGHAGHPENEHVDRLALAARKQKVKS
ncbi:MAG: ribonuclease HI [Trueperaceae bacterium]